MWPVNCNLNEWFACLGWQAIRTPGRSYSAQFDLMKDIRVKVFTLLSGPCTNGTMVKSKSYTELVQKPLSTGQLLSSKDKKKRSNIARDPALDNVRTNIDLFASRCWGYQGQGFHLCVPQNGEHGVQMGKKRKDACHFSAKSVFLVGHMSNKDLPFFFAMPVMFVSYFVGEKNIATINGCILMEYCTDILPLVNPWLLLSNHS